MTINISVLTLEDPANLTDWLYYSFEDIGVSCEVTVYTAEELLNADSETLGDVLVLPGFAPNWSSSVFENFAPAGNEITVSETQDIIDCVDLFIELDRAVFGVCGGFQLLAGLLNQQRVPITALVGIFNNRLLSSKSVFFNAAHHNGQAILTGGASDNFYPLSGTKAYSHSKPLPSDQSATKIKVVGTVTSFVGKLSNARFNVGGVQYHPEYYWDFNFSSMKKVVKEKASKLAFSILTNVLDQDLISQHLQQAGE